MLSCPLLSLPPLAHKWINRAKGQPFSFLSFKAEAHQCSLKPHFISCGLVSTHYCKCFMLQQIIDARTPIPTKAFPMKHNHIFAWRHLQKMTMQGPHCSKKCRKQSLQGLFCGALYNNNKKKYLEYKHIPGGCFIVNGCCRKSADSLFQVHPWTYSRLSGMAGVKHPPPWPLGRGS